MHCHTLKDLKPGQPLGCMNLSQPFRQHWFIFNSFPLFCARTHIESESLISHTHTHTNKPMWSVVKDTMAKQSTHVSPFKNISMQLFCFTSLCEQQTHVDPVLQTYSCLSPSASSGESTLIKSFFSLKSQNTTTLKGSENLIKTN